MEKLSDMIESLRPEIESGLKRHLGQSVADSLSYSLRGEVSKFAEAYITEHVLPEVRQQLENQKTEIIAAIVAAVKAACSAMGDKLLENALKKIANGYSLGKVAKELFD